MICSPYSHTPPPSKQAGEHSHIHQPTHAHTRTMNATRYFGVAAVVVIIEGAAAFDIRIKFIAEELAAAC